MILPMEHRTPTGLEIKMYPKEAKRIFGVKVNRNERDETEEELKARFARALAETDFDAIVRAYEVKEQPKPPASPLAKARARRKVLGQPAPLPAPKADDPLPMFLSKK